jgi:hypothetical protein
MPYTSNEPVAGRNDPKAAQDIGNPAPTVQYSGLAYCEKYAGNLRTVEQVLDSGLLPIGDVAAILGIEVKRLRGYIFRNRISDPIGDFHSVYGWSCRELVLRLRAADHSSGGAS